MMNAMAQPQGATQLQIGQMPMVGQTPVYQMADGGASGRPGAGPLAGSHHFMENGFRNALMDWRQQRPNLLAGLFGGGTQNWPSLMEDWRQQRPTRGDFNGGQVMTPGGGASGGPLPGVPAQTYPVPPMQTVPQAQHPMVGSQLGVIGMTPATNPYGLPSY